jgi:hypothetical protein
MKISHFPKVKKSSYGVSSLQRRIGMNILNVVIGAVVNEVQMK